VTGDIVMVLGIVAGAGVLGWLGGRLVRGYGPPGWPLGAESREAFWRRSLPWPTGVQEDSEIAWHVPVPDAPEPTSAARSDSRRDAQPIPPTQPQRRFVGR
jgi:hypothetical protein